jgi:DNA-binding CsgD family transcriptional regulator
MPAKKYHVKLTKEEREELLKLMSSGKTAARKLSRGRILLKADEGLKDREIVAALNTSQRTVERTRRRFVEGNLEKALNEDPRPGSRMKLDERAEAHLIAIACSDAPGGREHWPLRLLSDKLVELGHVESISYETVRQYLKKTL